MMRERYLHQYLTCQVIVGRNVHIIRKIGNKKIGNKKIGNKMIGNKKIENKKQLCSYQNVVVASPKTGYSKA